MSQFMTKTMDVIILDCDVIHMRSDLRINHECDSPLISILTQWGGRFFVGEGLCLVVITLLMLDWCGTTKNNS